MGTQEEDDEAFARRLQFEEQSQLLMAASAAQHQQESNHADGFTTEQEQRDLELAREFARRDMEEAQAAAARSIQQPQQRIVPPPPSSRSDDDPPIPRPQLETPLVNDDLIRYSNAHHAAEGSTPSWLANNGHHAVALNSTEDRMYRSSTGVPGAINANDAVNEPLEYARRLQQEAFLNLSRGTSPTPPQMHDTYESDLETARRLQAMEDAAANSAIGAHTAGGYKQPEIASLQLGSDHSLEHGVLAALAASSRNHDTQRLAQETEDERLAKFMAESGESLHGFTDEQRHVLMAEQEAAARKPGIRQYNTPAYVRSDPSVPAASVPTSFSELIQQSDPYPAHQPMASSGRATPTRGFPNEAAIPSAAAFGAEGGSASPSPAEPRRRRFFGGGQINPSAAAAAPVPAVISPAGVPRGIPPPPGGSLSAPPYPISPPTSGNHPVPVSPARVDAAPPEIVSPNSKPARRGWLSPLGGKRRNQAAATPPAGLTAPPIQPAAIEPVGRCPPAATGRSAAASISNVCAACGRGGGTLIIALERKYHIECFRCMSCNARIDPSEQFAFSSDDQGVKHPHHRRCFAEVFGIQCTVCRQSIPANDDGTVSFVKHPFFTKEYMCRMHVENRSNPVRRCSGCHRFEPQGEPFADLNDGTRCVCMACCRTVVVDNADIKPLWQQVLHFFERLGLAVWKEMWDIPILAVQSEALNDQMKNNPHGGSQMLARGLCLTDHSNCRRLKLSSQRFERSSRKFMGVDAESNGFTYFDVPEAGASANPNANVFAILCLSGLPRDLTTSILAHEATHAWIKLHPNYNVLKPLPSQVEEGCAQLLAMLLLREGLEELPPEDANGGDAAIPSDHTLREYFKFTIEREENEIYGKGFRKANKAYQDVGIEALLSHVVRYRDFPDT